MPIDWKENSEDELLGVTDLMLMIDTLAKF